MLLAKNSEVIFPLKLVAFREGHFEKELHFYVDQKGTLVELDLTLEGECIAPEKNSGE